MTDRLTGMSGAICIPDKAKVLLADDSSVNRLTLRAILRELNYDLVECASGEEVLAATRRDEFALILLDVVMPGLDGFETARRLREYGPSRLTPIIFLTALDADPEALDQGYSIGAVDFLTKPFRPIALRAKVRGLTELYLEKKRAQQASEQHRLLVDGTIDYAIFMLDTEGRIVTWNPGAQRLKGYRADEIIGSHFSRFYTQPDILRQWPQHELKVAADIGRFEDEGWRVRKDGSHFWANVIITALHDDQGKLRGFSKVTRDLTARRSAEEAVRRSEERFRLLVEGARDYAIFLLDPAGRVESWNTGAERIKRFRSDEIIGQHFSRFYPSEANEQSLPELHLKTAAAEGRIEDEGWRVRKDGSRFWANAIITALRDDAGNLKGFSKIIRDMTERKQAEENARRLLEESTARRVAEENSRIIEEQAERLHVTLSSIGDAVISTDAEGRIQFVNPIAEGLIGCTQANARDRFISDVFHIINETTREPVENPALIALKEGRIVGLANHTVLIAIDGKETYIDDSAAPIKSLRGEIIGSVLVFRDIGEKKRAERALRESTVRLRLALNAGQMQVWDWEFTRNIETNAATSPEMIAIDNFLGQMGLSLHPDERSRAQDLIRQAIAQTDGFDFEFRAVSQQKQTRWFAVRGKTLSDDELPTGRIVGIATDITRRKRIEQTTAFLAEASATLAVLIDFDSTVQKLASLAVPFFADWASVDLLDASGAIRRVAIAHVDPAKTAMGYEFYQRNPQELNPAYGLGQIIYTGTAKLIPDLTDDILGRSITNPAALAMIRKLGLRSFIGVPLRVRGKVLGVLSFVAAESGHTYDEADLAAAQNLADRGAVAMENARLYREIQDQDRRKDEFLATLAHELRNPLSPIRNSIQILKMPQVTEDMIVQTRDMMERQVNHLVHLVDDLLDVSRVMRGKIDLKKRPVEVSMLVTRALETVFSLIEQQELQVQTTIAPEPLLLDADPVRMVQIISNLLANAAKYNNPHGHIWITAVREGNQAVLRIRDDGIGISRDMLSHIFELFVQADQSFSKAQGGLGIGLTLVQNLVEMHGGTVQVQSAGLGQGAEFIVRLPLAAPKDRSSTPTELSSGQELAVCPLKIMIVDDNRDAANSLGILLRLQGHSIEIANDGPTAIAKAMEFIPDVIFLDIGMPGMDGYEVARRLRQSAGLERIVIVALTGWGQEQDRRRSADAGFNQHLVKPPETTTLEKLLSSVSSLLNPTQTNPSPQPPA